MCQLVLAAQQILDVLAKTCVAYMAACADNTPYIVPLWYQLDKTCENPAVYVQLRAGSGMAEMLGENDRVCMAFSLMERKWIDSVLLMGNAEITDEKDGIVTFRVAACTVSGRRLMLSA